MEQDKRDLFGVDTASNGDLLVLGAGITAVGFVGYRYWDAPITAILLAGLLSIATWLSIIDIRHHRLPNKIVGPLAGAVAAVVVVAGLIGGNSDRLTSSLITGVVMVLVLFVANLAGGIGMGDVKYSLPIGMTLGWFGWTATSAMILASTLTGAVVAIAMLLAGRGKSYRLPYGPFMSIGLAVGLFVAPA